jgi:Probable Zinc-ribbon domain
MAQTVAEHPALSPLWDATKNPDAASAVLTTSYKAAWWSCPRGHALQRAPRALLRDPACPQCKVAGSSASLADNRPALAALWHPEKNGDLTPSTVDATSTAPCWWRCPTGHDFQRAPLLMLRDGECPTCALAKTSLAVTHPTIAAEWHATRNDAVTPQRVDADHIMTARPGPSAPRPACRRAPRGAPRRARASGPAAPRPRPRRRGADPPL